MPNDARVAAIRERLARIAATQGTGSMWISIKDIEPLFDALDDAEAAVKWEGRACACHANEEGEVVSYCLKHEQMQKALDAVRIECATWKNLAGQQGRRIVELEQKLAATGVGPSLGSENAASEKDDDGGGLRVRDALPPTEAVRPIEESVAQADADMNALPPDLRRLAEQTKRAHARRSPGVCNPHRPTLLQDGSWTCERCSADMTAEMRKRLASITPFAALPDEWLTNIRELYDLGDRELADEPIIAALDAERTRRTRDRLAPGDSQYPGVSPAGGERADTRLCGVCGKSGVGFANRAYCPTHYPPPYEGDIALRTRLRALVGYLRDKARLNHMHGQVSFADGIGLAAQELESTLSAPVSTRPGAASSTDGPTEEQTATSDSAAGTNLPDSNTALRTRLRELAEKIRQLPLVRAALADTPISTALATARVNEVRLRKALRDIVRVCHDTNPAPYDRSYVVKLAREALAATDTEKREGDE